MKNKQQIIEKLKEDNMCRVYFLEKGNFTEYGRGWLEALLWVMDETKDSWIEKLKKKRKD